MIFRTKTYDTITAGLTKMVTELETLALAQGDAAARSEEAAVKALEDARAAREDADRAMATATKIAGLLA